MIRVLNIMGWGLGCGGAEARIMNYYRNIDRTKIQFDFLMPTHEYEDGFYYEEAISLGAKVYSGPKSKNLFLRTLNLGRILKKNPEYKIIIVHHDKPKFAMYTAIAKLLRVPVRIVDSCNHIPNMPFTMKAFRPLLRLTATHLMSVSEKASNSMFGKKASGDVILFKQARDLNIYRYSPERRPEMRKKLGVADELVLLNVGRIGKQKNHAFLLDAFALVRKEYPETMLLVAGDGDSRELSKLREQAFALGLDNAVHFLGQRSDIPDLLQAADIFCLPSLYEGLPGAAIEAQAAGLPCLISDTVAVEAKATENVELLPIDKGADIWVRRILAYKDFDRRDTIDIMRKKGYDIGGAAQWLEAFLLNSLEI